MSKLDITLERARNLVIILVLPLIVAAAPVILVYAVHTANVQQAKVTCEILQSTIENVESLRAIAHELGLPGNVSAPSYPAECQVVAPWSPPSPSPSR